MRLGRGLLLTARALLVPALAVAALAAALTPAAAGVVAVLRSDAQGSGAATAAGFTAAYHGPTVGFVLDQENPAALASRIAALRPDVVVAVGLRAALFTRDRLPRTPLVYCNVLHPLRQGLTGTEITGVNNEVSPAAELKALRAVAPDVRRVAVFYGRATGAEFQRALGPAAGAAGVELVEVAISALAEFAAKAREGAARADALWLPAEPTVATPEAFQFLLKLSVDQRKPFLVFSDALVRAGALVAVTPDYAGLGEQLVDLVRRVQAGERPGDIPPATPRRSHLVVNEATARALGREIPTLARQVGEVLP
jgi:putative ABC transport system substrate-binding protein